MVDRTMQTRRRLLGACAGTVGVMALAGCLGGDDDDDSNEGNSGSDADPASWPMHGFDPQNTGHHPTTTGPKSDVEVKWSFEADHNFYGGPVIADGLVCALSRDRYTYALDVGNGEVEWKVETGGASTPVISGDRIVTGNLTGLDLATGDELWSISKAVSEPIVVDGEVYSSRGRELAVVDVEDGDDRNLIEIAWENRGTPDSPAFKDGLVFTSAGERFMALDVTSGEVEWESESSSGERMSGSIPATGDSVVVASDTDRTFYGFDIETGEILWESDDSPRADARPSIVDGIAYVGQAGAVVGIDIETGDVSREIDVDGSASGKDPVIVDGALYLETTDQLLAYDLESGERLWSFSVADQFNTSPAVVDGVVYIASYDNHLYALEEA